MITVRDLANDLAGQGVTRERFHEILSGFGIDSYAPGADAMDVEQQVASVPLLGHEGAAIGAPPPIEPPPPPEPAPRFDMPTALTPQTQAALLPAPQRPLPYATDVQRPDITAPRMTAAPTPTPTPPGRTAYEEGRRGWEQQLEGLGSPMLRGVREGAEGIVSHLARPDEPPELTREREAQRGLDPYQKAGVGDWPEIAKARLHAATVRTGSLAGTAAGAATSLGLEAYARYNPEEWASDEVLEPSGTLGFPSPPMARSPEDRRMWDAQWERERGEVRNVMNAIIEEAVKRNEEQGFLENVRDSAYELIEATAHILSWMSGGDIPKEFWRESERVEREELLANMAGVEVQGEGGRINVASPHTVLEEEAGKRWPELGREIISFLGATFNEPAEVAAAYPVPLIALIYPLARRLGIPLSERASAAGAAVSKKLQQSNVPYLGAFVDAMNEAWSGFQRWKVDPAHMADPAIRQLAENLLREAANTEFGVGALGPQLARTMKRPPKAAEVVEGRPMFEEFGRLPEEPPVAEPSRFTWDFTDIHDPITGQKIMPAEAPPIIEPPRLGLTPGAEPFVRPGEPAPHTIRDAIALAKLMTEENAPAVMRMVRGGVPLRAIADRLARSRDPQSTTMAPTEVARRPHDPAEMPSFEPAPALPEGHTRADVGLPRREFAAPGEGGLRATEAPEVLPEVAQTRAAMEARRVPSPEEPVVRPGYEMVEGSEVLRQTKPVELEPGVDLMPAERRIPDFQPEPLQIDARGRSDYSPPKLEAGLKPPRESRGLVFEQKKYVLNEDGTLSPARTRTKEGRLVDEPPDVVARDPEVVGVTPEQMRIVENAAEFFGEDSPIAGIRGDIGLRQMMYEELQLSMYDNIANLMQSKAYREYAATRLANAIREQTGGRRPVSRDAILEVLEEAAETGKINDVAIGFIDANGSPKRVSVVDAMTRALKSDPELAAKTSEALVQANFKRLGTRARKFMHQENLADAILEWHPEYRGNPEALMDAIRNPPDIPTELNALIDRYTHWGELPPVIRNTAKQLLDEARVQGRLHHEGATIGLEGLKRAHPKATAG